MSDQKRNLDSLFEKAAKIESQDERSAFLEQSCGDDVALRQQVEQLLISDQQAGSFLEEPPIGLEATISNEGSGEDRAASLEAGLTSAFSSDEAVVMGDQNHSVLKMLGQTLGSVPRVALRDPAAEGDDPIAKPNSPEIPHSDSDSRYRLDGEIARGGMGAIIKGRDTDLGRDLVIKVLLDVHKDKPEVIQRFVEEAQIGGQLQHPGIAPIYELGQFADQRPFFAMKLVKGETLAKLLADREEAADERGKLIGIFEQICQTMAYAHSRGVIHRDLKPANIMVGAFGEVQVMDWGLAKVLQSGGVADEKKAKQSHQGQSIIQTLRSQPGSDTPATFGTVGSQTQMGSVMGTPAYMPPEQALGEIDNMDERADVFGLGAILTEILTGKPPYVADNENQVFRMASRGKLDECLLRLDDCGADVELTALTRDCLEREPKDRPRNAGELADRVSGYLDRVEKRLREAELAKVDALARAEEFRRRRNLHVVIAGILLLGLIGAGFAAAHFHSMEMAQRTLVDEKSALATSNEELAETREDARQTAARERDAARVAEAAMEKLAAQADRQREVAERENYRSTIRLAESMLQGEPQVVFQVADLLWKTQPELRGWEWGHLMARCPLEEWSFNTNHGEITALAASPDGRYLVTAGVDQTVALWDSWTQKEIWRQHTRHVRHLSIDPLGRFVSIGSARDWQFQFKIVDFRTGQLITRGPNKGNSQVIFSSDGKHLYVWRGATLIRYETETWEPVAEVKIWNSHPASLFLDVTGRYIGVQRNFAKQEALKKHKWTFRFRDSVSLEPVTELKPLNVEQSGLHLYSTPILDSARGLFIRADGNGRIFRATLSDSSDSDTSQVGSLSGNIEHLAYDEEADAIIAASDDGAGLVIDSDQNSRRFYPGSAVRGLANLGEGRFVTAGADGTVECWTVKPPISLAVNLSIAPSDKTAAYAEFYGDGQKLLLKTWERDQCSLIDLNSLEHRTLQVEAGKSIVQVLRPKTNELVIRDETGLSFSEIPEADFVDTFTKSLEVEKSKASVFDPSGRVLFVRAENNELFVYDLEKNETLPCPDFSESKWARVAVSQTRAAVHSSSGLDVWEFASGQLVSHLDVPAVGRFPNKDRALIEPAFHPGEQLIALIAAHEKGTGTRIIIWDPDTQNRQEISASTAASFWKLQFTPDGNRLVVVCSDSRIRVYDWKIGRELIALSGTTPNEQQCPLAISPDGRTIAYGGHNPPLRIAKSLPWNLGTSPSAEFYLAVDEFRAFTRQAEMRGRDAAPR